MALSMPSAVERGEQVLDRLDRNGFARCQPRLQLLTGRARCDTCAGISIPPRSVRRNRMPEFGGGGHRATCVTFLPECKPIPAQLTDATKGALRQDIRSWLATLLSKAAATPSCLVDLTQLKLLTQSQFIGYDRGCALDESVAQNVSNQTRTAWLARELYQD